MISIWIQITSDSGDEIVVYSGNSDNVPVISRKTNINCKVQGLTCFNNSDKAMIPWIFFCTLAFKSFRYVQ